MTQKLWLGLLLLGFFCEGAWSCVGCRTPGDSLGNPEQTVQAGIALSWSVLFLLAAVFGVLTLLGWIVVKACKQADARHNFPHS